LLTPYAQLFKIRNIAVAKPLALHFDDSSSPPRARHAHAWRALGGSCFFTPFS
jgi:hypothetical protein